MQGLRTLTDEANARGVDDDFLVAGDEGVERVDALHIRTALLAGARGLVGLTAELGAIGKHRLQGLAVKARDGKLGQTLIDGPLMACVNGPGNLHARPRQGRRPANSLSRYFDPQGRLVLIIRASDDP